MNTCSSCLFMTGNRCHRYPPTVFQVTGVYGTNFESHLPFVENLNFCGEWQPRDSVLKAPADADFSELRKLLAESSELFEIDERRMAFANLAKAQRMLDGDDEPKV